MKISRLIAAGTAVGVLALAGCGSDSDSGSGSGSTSNGPVDDDLVGAAQAAVEAGSAPVTTIDLPTEAPEPARDKRVVAVTCTNQGDGCPISAEGVREASEQFGWTVDIIDGKGDPAVWNSAILNAISSKADAIVLSAVAPDLVRDALDKAQDAGIPIVSMFEPANDSNGIYGFVRPNHPEQGTLAGNWLVADSKAGAKIVMVRDAEFVALEQRIDEVEKVLEDCSGCEVVAEVDSTLSTLATRLPGAVAGALQQNPDATYVVTPTDNHALFASQGIQQAGRPDVSLVGFDGNSPSYQLVAEGTQAMDVVESYSLQGWLATDLLIRAFAGEEGGREYLLPSRLFTQETMPTELWQTETDFRAELTDLWTHGG